MYTSLGLFAVVFVTHGLCLYDFAVQKRRFALEWMALMAFLNLSGALIYAARVCVCLPATGVCVLALTQKQFPEKWYPYRFDFLGASHQIFHVMVLAAGLVHYKGLADAFIEVRGTDQVC